MTPETDGKPALKPTGRGLGVRRAVDLAVDERGNVHPSTGGMSVAPCSAWKVPNHRRPIGMGKGSTGPAGDRIYAVPFEGARGEGLTIRPDPARPFLHAFIEPSATMPCTAYENALTHTRPHWRQVWP